MPSCVALVDKEEPMSALSITDTTRQSTDDIALDNLNPVVEAIDRSWQRLLTQSEWTPQRLQLRCLSYEDEPAPRRGMRVLRKRGYATHP